MYCHLTKFMKDVHIFVGMTRTMMGYAMNTKTIYAKMSMHVIMAVREYVHTQVLINSVTVPASLAHPMSVCIKIFLCTLREFAQFLIIQYSAQEVNSMVLPRKEINVSNAQMVVTGNPFDCAIDASNDVYCWDNRTFQR